MEAKSKKRKAKADEQQFLAGILVTMKRDELNAIKAAIPEGVPSSQWCRDVLIDAARKLISPDQPTIFSETFHG